jgi:tetratricopeptide (TPR) repeat protein
MDESSFSHEQAVAAVARCLTLSALREGLKPLLCCCFLVAFSPIAVTQASPTQSPGYAAVKQPATQNPAPAQPEFDKLAAEAGVAREADRIEDSIALYRKALGLRPDWSEGWWYLATLYYDGNNYVEAARAFRETARLQGKAGAPWAMLGLCEFQLERYDDAMAHIRQGRQLGLGDNAELARVMRYHEGLLYLVKGEFERAQVILDTLSFEGLNSNELIIALGLSVLRMGMLPKEVNVDYRDRAVVRRAGLAEHFSAQKNISDAVREYELLARDFPTFPNAHYAYGRFLLATRDNDGALAAFQRELQNSPKHALARMQIAFIYLINKEATAGLPYAEEAIKLHPRLPLGHYIMGRLLFDTGQTALAIQKLELARSMVPDEPKIHFALTRAYSKANRKADADLAREAFMRLTQQADKAAARGEVSGAAIPVDDP